MKAGEKIKVLVNAGAEARKEIEAEIIEVRTTTVVVKLPDGNIITRKKERDITK
jgi:hypothetical protein